MVGISRSVARYKPKEREGESELRDQIRGLSRRHKRYGYRRITALIRREGLIVNHKRVHRLWKEEGLALPRRRPKRRRVGETVEMVNKAIHKDHVWAYDFVEDRTETIRDHNQPCCCQ